MRNSMDPYAKKRKHQQQAARREAKAWKNLRKSLSGDGKRKQQPRPPQAAPVSAPRQGGMSERDVERYMKAAHVLGVALDEEKLHPGTEFRFDDHGLTVSQMFKLLVNYHRLRYSERPGCGCLAPSMVLMLVMVALSIGGLVDLVLEHGR